MLRVPKESREQKARKFYGLCSVFEDFLFLFFPDWCFCCFSRQHVARKENGRRKVSFFFFVWFLDWFIISYNFFIPLSVL